MNLPVLQKDERPQSKGLKEYQTEAIRKAPHKAHYNDTKKYAKISQKDSLQQRSNQIDIRLSNSINGCKKKIK